MSSCPAAMVSEIVQTATPNETGYLLAASYAPVKKQLNPFTRKGRANLFCYSGLAFVTQLA